MQNARAAGPVKRAIVTALPPCIIEGVARSSSWREMHDASPSRLPGPDNLGWWGAVAFLVAVILHVAAFFALGHIKIALGMPGEELVTGPVNLEQVAILPPDEELSPADETPSPPPKVADLLEDVDILAKLPEQELEMKPDIKQPEFSVKLADPALEGDPSAVTIDPTKGFDIDTALPEFGRTQDPLPLAAEGQVVVDPGAAAAADDSLDKFTEEIIRKGANGRSKTGSLDGMVTLDDMAGLPADVLVGKKTMLPSDLLFEYNSAVLRESARKGLMKLALVIDRNPALYCWIEGHTDLYGGDGFNLDLSRRRAAAVRTYLSGPLHLPADKIMVRGFGKQQPLVRSGTVEEQAPNRRVEIRMRRTPPPPEAALPPAAAGESMGPAPRPLPVDEPEEAMPTGEVPAEEEEAVLVKPRRVPTAEEMNGGPVPKARPVEESPPHSSPAAPPKARPARETPPAQTHPRDPQAPKAVPVEDEEPAAPRAKEVDDDDDEPDTATEAPLRAVPVE